MEYYLPLKLVHILSSTVLFGTGIGSAFFMWRADRSGDIGMVAVVSRQVVIADWCFTTPAVVVQPLTGFAMVWLAGFPLSSSWLLLSIALYGFIGLCWLPVVWIQCRIARDSAKADAEAAGFNYPHRYLMRYWYALGWAAFVSMLGIFFLMVFKPVLW
ncbi:MAG: hypothetical protein B0D91_12285 [Oceanospirillales bacterium LUC14_002_19_P2]|nr:MAG: hypothetical protein B0D91_12285 [Oceanospirillales bacterium LUC14_002_19_P2]